VISRALSGCFGLVVSAVREKKTQPMTHEGSELSVSLLTEESVCYVIYAFKTNEYAFPLDLHVMTIFNFFKYAFPLHLVMTWLKFFIRL
jgi:hypothetical protein